MAAHDLAALWDAHCRFEFETRDVDATMATMVAEPYVNHIPTMTGGVGFDKLRDFYANHFIGVNPPRLRTGARQPHRRREFGCRRARRAVHSHHTY
jgi:hypothetical protein